MSQAGLLSIKQIIGVRSSVTNGLAFQDEQTVVYIAGGNIVLYGIDQKAQKVIPCSINAQGKFVTFFLGGSNFLMKFYF